MLVYCLSDGRGLCNAHLSVILSIEIDYVHGAATVVLNNLVLGVVRAAADNPALLAFAVSFLRDD